MLVEDDDAHAFLFQHVFEDLGFGACLRRVADGDAVFTSIGQTRVPQLVLLDQQLRRGDGLDVLRRIRAAPELAHVPVVMISSIGSKKVIAAAYEAGANGYLLKPLALRDLADMAASVVAFWLKWNQFLPKR